MAGDGGSIFLLVAFICCALSLIIGLITWANGGSLPGGLTAAQISNALSGIKFTRAEQENVIQYKETTGAFNFGKVLNGTTLPGTDLGSVVTGKTQNDCDALCHSTQGCVGYTIDGSNCQLKNNVTLLEFKANTGNLYASSDIGGVLYQHFPYSRVEDGLYQSLWTFHGSLADAVSNCHANKTACQGFTWDGTNTAVMYSRILALDGSQHQTGQVGVYTTLDKLPQYVNVPNQSFGDAPTNTVTEIFPRPSPFNPSTDADYFTLWNSGWSAGPDSLAQKKDGVGYGPGATASSNTIVVQDLNKCMNVCLSNTWCQSIVFDNSTKSCYMRRDQVAWPAHDLDRPTQQLCIPGQYYDAGEAKDETCSCGVIDNSSCNTNIIHAHDGMSDGNKVSYARMNPPLAQFCPQQCSNDVNCVVGWYDTSNQQCNLYEFTPTQTQTGQSTKTTTWMLQNFPG